MIKRLTLSLLALALFAGVAGAHGVQVRVGGYGTGFRVGHSFGYGFGFGGYGGYGYRAPVLFAAPCYAPPVTFAVPTYAAPVQVAAPVVQQAYTAPVLQVQPCAPALAVPSYGVGGYGVGATYGGFGYANRFGFGGRFFGIHQRGVFARGPVVQIRRGILPGRVVIKVRR